MILNQFDLQRLSIANIDRAAFKTSQHTQRYIGVTKFMSIKLLRFIVLHSLILRVSLHALNFLTVRKNQGMGSKATALNFSFSSISCVQ